MKKLAQARTKLFGSLAAVILSSATMIWLFWHHPLSAALVTFAVLSAFGVSAYLARWIEPDAPDVGGFNRGG